MLQRLYATAWPTKDQLSAHLAQLEEAKKRDHRKLGPALDLFSIQELAGPGLIFWHPKGGRTRLIMEDWLRAEALKRGYQMVYTPHIANVDLWHTSGHTSFYRQNMFGEIEVEKADYQLKPMNCPFHILIYQGSLRSYKDLPLRYAELGTVYRYERSGVLHGLLRVRGFTQDDAHIFCTPDQIESEVDGCVDSPCTCTRPTASTSTSSRSPPGTPTRSPTTPARPTSGTAPRAPSRRCSSAGASPTSS
jgi:threonyl-tRNA synthetase